MGRDSLLKSMHPSAAQQRVARGVLSSPPAARAAGRAAGMGSFSNDFEQQAHAFQNGQKTAKVVFKKRSTESMFFKFQGVRRDARCQRRSHLDNSFDSRCDTHDAKVCSGNSELQ